MPRVRVPVPGYRVRPGVGYPVRPPASKGGLLGLLGGLGGLLICLLCLATMGLLGLFAAFIAVTTYLGWVYSALRAGGNNAPGFDVNMIILLAALCFAGFYKLQRSL